MGLGWDAIHRRARAIPEKSGTPGPECRLVPTDYRRGRTARRAEYTAAKAATSAAPKDGATPQASRVADTTKKNAAKPKRPTTNPRMRRASASGPCSESVKGGR